MEIKIASPCSARWEDMEGNERQRFCAQCQKSVYDFSKMEPEQVAALIGEAKGRVCARLYKRSDGRMLLENCPRGVARQRHTFRRIAVSVGALFLLLVTAAFARKVRSSGASDSPVVRDVKNKVDDAMWKVKGWVGIHKPMIMGEICPVVVPTPVSTNTAPQK